MWGEMFWTCQFAFSIGYYHIYTTGTGKVPFVYVGIIQKLLFAMLLGKARFGDKIVLDRPAVGILIAVVEVP
jgi:hypothetical protein